MSEQQIRLTPTVADVFRRMRHSPMTTERCSQVVGATRNGEGIRVRFWTEYAVGNYTFSERTARAILALPWVNDNGELTDPTIYVDTKGFAHKLESSEAVDARYEADAEKEEERRHRQFVKSFPKHYLSLSLNKVWMCDDYDEYVRWGGRLVCPISDEPLLQIPVRSCAERNPNYTYQNISPRARGEQS